MTDAGRMAAREDHPGRLALWGAVKRSPSETGEETGEERIVDPGANLKRLFLFGFLNGGIRGFQPFFDQAANSLRT